MSDCTIIQNGTVVTLGDSCRVIEDGAVLVRGRLFDRVGTRAELASEPGARIDACGGLILPGFINLHNHFYGTFACGIALKDPPPTNFKEILERLWWRLDKALTLDDVRASAVVPLCRALRAGTTTVFDHHASPRAVRGSLDVIAGAAAQVGVRTCLCYEVSDRDGPGVTRAGLAENEAFIHSCAGGSGMSAALFGLHASMTLADDSLRAAVQLGQALGAGFHIHVAESRFDQDDSLAKYGKRVVKRLADAGVLGERTICAHGIHLDDVELEVLAASGSIVAHNPQSNMNNAVGAARVSRMMELGILVGLGSDGMTANMLDELRAAHLLQRHATGDPRVGFTEACRMLLDNNRRIASRYFRNPLGALAPGHCADLIVVDYFPPTPLAAENLYGHVMFGLPSAPVRLTLVDGVVRMRDGVVLGVDEREVTTQAAEQARSMWARF